MKMAMTTVSEVEESKASWKKLLSCIADQLFCVLLPKSIIMRGQKILSSSNLENVVYSKSFERTTRNGTLLVRRETLNFPATRKFKRLARPAGIGSLA